MGNRAMLHVALLAVLALAAFEVRAGEIAWSKIVGAEKVGLSAEQKTRVTNNLNRLNNTRGCQGTLAHCLNKGDMTARRHAGYVVRMVYKGKDDAEIQKGIANRKASAHPEEVFNIDVSNHPISGNANAKVVLVEYACFQCPFCAHLAPQLKKLKSIFGDKAVHYYKFFPVRSHDRGVPTALAGVAAYRQGKFWQMYDLMFENRSDLDDDDILAYAKKVGLDIAKFQADIKDPGAMRYIEKDKLEGMRLGVEGTPTFFLNGKEYKGQQEFNEIVDRIAEEIDIVEGRIP
jgi:protein-disulfide isomerase